MSQISIENMKFYAYHGCFEEEQVIGTDFCVSIWFETDTQKAEITDNVLDTVDYSQVYAVIKQQMAIPSHILEHVGRRIINAVKENFKNITDITLKISKLNPPVGGQMDKVSVLLKG
ncbi:MAG: dihydroneopterin aldolase [Bacteroidales bacterium]|nr:dihydroneopterin aldolase [Bacteroidales bacterium]